MSDASAALPDGRGPALATMRPMFAAQPWDWWIALVLFVAGVGALLALVVGYFAKVVSPQFPRRNQRQRQ